MGCCFGEPKASTGEGGAKGGDAGRRHGTSGQSGAANDSGHSKRGGNGATSNPMRILPGLGTGAVNGTSRGSGGGGGGGSGAGAGAGASGGAGAGAGAGAPSASMQDVLATAKWIHAAEPQSSRAPLKLRALSVYIASAVPAAENAQGISDATVRVSACGTAHLIPMADEGGQGKARPLKASWWHFVGPPPNSSSEAAATGWDTLSFELLTGRGAAAKSLGTATTPVSASKHSVHGATNFEDIILATEEGATGFSLRVGVQMHDLSLMEVTFERVALTAHALGGCNQVWIELQPVGARVKTAKSRLTETAAVFHDRAWFWASVGSEAENIGVEVWARRDSSSKEEGKSYESCIVGSTLLSPRELFGTDVPTPVPAVLYRGASGVAAAMGVDTGLSHAVGQLSLTAVIGKGQRLQPEALLQSVVASMRVSFEGTETRQHRPIPSTAAVTKPEWVIPAVEEASDAIKRLRVWMEHPTRKVCADCGAPDPTWASAMFGTVFCAQCAGIHRRVGTNHDFTQNVVYDTKKWTLEVVQKLEALATNPATQAPLAHAVAGVEPITPASDAASRSMYIRKKYGFPSLTSDEMKHLQRRHNKQQAIGILMVKVVGAKNLINADTFSKSDPFCIVRLGNSKDFRTKTINNNLNPTWNALFQMKRYKQEELLYVQVMDADVFSSDPLGDACISLEGIPDGEGDKWQSLEVPLHGVAHGSVILKLLYSDYSQWG